MATSKSLLEDVLPRQSLLYTPYNKTPEPPLLTPELELRPTDTSFLRRPDFFSNSKYASNRPTVVSNPHPPSSRVTLEKFSGYTEEDGDKFLKEFTSYIKFNSIGEDDRIIAAFHLHLAGPALIWYNQLTDLTKLSWNAVQGAFKERFFITSPLDPSLIMESAVFDTLKLGPGQHIEDFHSAILEKGQKLGKPERDLINKFIEGLPPRIAFFVRVGRCTNYNEALNLAKTAVCHYQHDVNIAQTASMKQPSSDIANLSSDIHKLTTAVQQLVSDITKSHPPPVPQSHPLVAIPNSTHQPPNPAMDGVNRECFGCHAFGHIKRACCWSGRYPSNPALRCQLCSQNGHEANDCVWLNQGNRMPPRSVARVPSGGQQ